MLIAETDHTTSPLLRKIANFCDAFFVRKSGVAMVAVAIAMAAVAVAMAAVAVAMAAVAVAMAAVAVAMPL